MNIGKLEGIILSALEADVVLQEIGYRLDTLQKADDRWKCFCPIHRERIFRSLTIETDARKYSCGYNQCMGSRGGDYLGLYAAAKGISREDAIRFWAARMNLPLPEEEPLQGEEEPSQSAGADGALTEAAPIETLPGESVDADIPEAPAPGAAPTPTEAGIEVPSAEVLTARGYLARYHHLRSSGSAQQAVELLEEAVAKYPEDLDLLDVAADSRGARGDTAGAREALVHLAAAYRTQGSREGELRTLKRALFLDSRDQATRMAIVRLCSEQDMIREAIHHLYEGSALLEEAGDLDGALECYRKITELDPAEARALQRLAEIHIDRKDHEAAAAAFLSLARFYEQREVLEKACDAYQQLLDLTPEDLEARRELARLLTARGRRREASRALMELAEALEAQNREQEAAECLAALIEHEPENASVRVRLAEIHDSLGRTAEALEQYRAVAAVAEREGDTERAAAALRRVHAGAPGEGEVLDRLVRVLVQRGKYDEARDILCRQVQYELSEGDGGCAARWLRTLLDFDPHDTDTAIALAHQLRQGASEEELVEFVRFHTQFLASSSSTEEAIQLLDALPSEVAELEGVRAVRETLKPSGPVETPSAERSFDAAERAYREGLHEEARRRFEEARELGADPVACLGGLVRTAVGTRNAAEVVQLLPEFLRVFEAEGREGESVGVCLEILAQLPEHEALRRQCSTYLRKSGHSEELIAGLEARLKASPADHHAALELAELHIEGGRTGDALSVMDEAADRQLEIGSPELAEKIVRRALAVESEDQKRHAVLAEALTRSGRSEDGAEVLVSLARRRRSQGRIPEAGHLLGRALEYSPSYLPALREDFEASLESRDDEWVRRCARRLARAYAASELHGKAVETLSRARRLLPDDPVLLEEALAVYEEMGSIDRAVESVLELVRLQKRAENDEAVLGLCQRGLVLAPAHLGLWEELARTEEKVKGLEACEETLVRLAGVYRDKGLNGKRLEVLARLRDTFRQSARVWGLSLAALEETGNRPEMARVLTAQARYLREDGDLGAARETLERALEITPEDVDVVRELASLCLELGDADGAATHYGAVCELLHSDPPPTDPETADILVDAYRHILEIAPEVAQPRLRLASLLFRNGQRGEAAALYRDLSTGEAFQLTGEERLEVLERLAELDPEDVGLQWDLGVMHREAGDRDRESEILCAVSERGFSTRRFDLAAQARARLTELSPGDPSRWLELAEVLEALDRSAEASEALGKAATIYLQRLDSEAAEPLLLRLAEAGTESPEILAALARAAERKGQTAEAAGYLVRMGSHLLDRGDAEAAVENLRHACELEPRRRDHKERLLEALVAQRSYRRAIGIALSLVASAQEEEERLRILKRVHEWQLEDADLVGAIIPAFEHVYPGQEGIRLLAGFLCRAEELAKREGLAPAPAELPEGYLAHRDFWSAYLQTGGRSLSVTHYGTGICQLLEQGADGEARRVCERGLEVHGDVRPLVERQLEILERIGAADDEKCSVVERLTGVCEQSGDREAAGRYRRMLRSLRAQEEPEEAEAVEDPGADFRLRARQYAEAGSPHDAIVEWRRVLEAVPGDTEALEQLWELSARIGDMGAARQAGHLLAEAACARGEVEEGIDWYQMVLDRMPSDLETCQRLAELCLGLGRREEGIGYVRRLAEIHAERGEEEEEMRVLERLHLLEPGESNLERLAALYEETDSERAVETYQAILERAERVKDVARASEAALAIVRLAGGGGDALRGLATRFEHLDENERARATYAEAAEAFRGAGEGIKALECYRSAQRLGERSPALSVTMADIYRDFGNLVEAEVSLWHAWDMLEAEGKDEELLELARRILALGTDNLAGYARAIGCLDAASDRLPPEALEGVRKEFLEGLARHPASPRARDILEGLSRRWTDDERVGIDLLAMLGTLLQEADSPKATGCWVAVAERAWAEGNEAARDRALTVLREIDLSLEEREAVIGLWETQGVAEAVLPEMLTQMEALRRVGQAEAALAISRRVLEVDAGNERAHRALPELLERSGDPAGARQARLGLARRLLESGQRDEAIHAGRDLLTRHGDDKDTLKGLKELFAEAEHVEGLVEVGRRQVEVYVEEGRYDAAMADLEELRRRIGDSASLLLKMAEVARFQGDRNRERELRRESARVRSASEDYGRAVENYRSMLEEDPEAVELRLDLAGLLWEKGFSEDAKREQIQAIEFLLQQQRSGEAREAIDALLERVPDDSTVLEASVRWAEQDEDPNRQKELLQRWGRVLSSRGERERAVAVYRELASWSPEDVSLRRSLVDLLHDLDRTDEAVDELVGLVRAARDSGDRATAVSSAEAAWRLDPESREASALVAELAEEGEGFDRETVAGAFRCLAESAVATGDAEEADAWIARGIEAGVAEGEFEKLREAVEARREVPVPEMDIDAKVEEADAAFEAGDADRGQALYESVLAQSPSDLILFGRYAQALVRAGRADAAFRLLEEKADALQRADDYEGASYCCEQLADLRPERIEPLLRLGRLQCFARDEQRAWATLSRAIDLVIGDEAPEEAKEHAAATVRECLTRLPDRAEVWERVYALESALSHTPEARAALKSLHRLAHQSGRTLEAVEALERIVGLHPVAVSREEWRAPVDWTEEDASLHWNGLDATGVEGAADAEEVRRHLRQRLELATYHLRYGLQDMGTRELVVAGEIARIHGFWKQARKCYTESLKWMKHLGERTGQRAVWNGLVDVELATGDAESARRTVRSWAVWEEEQGDLERALEVRKSYLESEPRDLSIREDLVARAWEWDHPTLGWEQGLVLASCLEEKDLYGRAEALYRGLIQRAKEPRFAAELGSRIGEARGPLLRLLRDRGDQAAAAEVQCAEAEEAKQAGDFGRAATLLGEVLPQRQQDAAFLEDLATCHRKAGNETAAVDHEFALARLYRSSGMMTKAVELGRSVVRSRPKGEDSLSFLTECYRESGEYAAACSFYWQVVNGLYRDGRLPDAAPILEEIEGLADRVAGNWAMLGQTWSQLEQPARAGRAYYRAGTAAIKMGDFPDAARNLEKARDYVPDDAEVARALEQVEAEMGRRGKAGRREDLAAAIERARQREDRSETCRLLEEYVAEFPDDVEAQEKLVDLLVAMTGARGGVAAAALSARQRERVLRLSESLANHYLASGETARAVRFIRTTVELAPERLDLQRSLMDHYASLGLQSEAARLGMELAGRLASGGNGSAAVTLYRDILKLDPANVEARSELAKYLAESGRQEEAKEEFRALAAAYAQKELLGKAISGLQSAVSLDPEDESLRREMAQLYALKGNTGAALNELKNVEERCRRRGDLEASAAVLAEMVRLDPERGSIREQLARTWMDLGDRSRAFGVYRDLAHLYHERELPGRMIEAARKALVINSEDEGLSRMMVEAYRDRGELRMALDEARRMAALGMQRSAADGERLYREILEWEPEDPESMLALAQCCERERRDSEASDHYESLGRLYQSQARFLEATRMWSRALELNDRKMALKEELAEVFLDLGDEYHGDMLLEELSEHYEKLGQFDEAANRWVRLADRQIQKAMELPA